MSNPLLRACRKGLAVLRYCSWVEVIVLVSALATAAVICFRAPLLSRDIVMTPDKTGQKPGEYSYEYSYGDNTSGGTSKATAVPNAPLSWICNLGEGYAYPFCGVGLRLASGVLNGIDLSGFNSVDLSLDVHGPGSLARIYLKNANPAYSRPGDPQSDKFNYVDVALSPGSQTLKMPLSSFAVADWWKASGKIPPGLGRPEFTDIVGFEVQLGLDGHLGKYTIKFSKLTFERRLLTDEQLYTLLGGYWLFLVLGLLWQRRTQARKLEQKEAVRLRWASEHDSLTKLPNRTAFQCRLQTAILNAMERGSSVVLLLVDLDYFKHVNDSLGHAAGDELLKCVAPRLEECVEQNAFVARIGGDEFAVILSGGQEADVLSIGDRIVRTLRSPMKIRDRQVVVGASVGAAVFPNNVHCGGELFNAADTALYALKHSGRGGTKLFDETILKEARRSASHLNIARVAAMGKSVIPFYQPTVDLRSGETVGFEALLRCGDLAGIQSPAILEEAFADYEVATELAGLMHQQVAHDVSKWVGEGHCIGRIAINAAPAEFLRDDYAERFLKVLADKGVLASHFAIEVTEHVFIGRANEYVARAIKLLKSAGVHISLDDFGTGYSSLSHLRDLRVDAVKMDKSFIDKITDAGEACAIVGAVVSLARTLGITTVAEGVETEPQTELLRSMGCDLAQGYFFGRPVDARTVGEQLFRKAA